VTPARVRVTAALLLLLPGCGGGPPADDATERVVGALARSVAWLEAHPPDPEADPLGTNCLDAWTWYVLSAWHPEPSVRTRAAVETDRRLGAMRRPEQWTVVTLSYWATVLQLMRLREPGRALGPQGPTEADVESALRSANPTTAWWTRELLRHAGFPSDPDFSGTFVATTADDPKGWRPTTRDAYRLYHEVAPATGLGHAAPDALGAEHLEFVRRSLPALIGAARTDGDTDAVAEALVAAALVGERDTPTYREGIAWLLEQQREDGTYHAARDLARAPTVNDSRHAVLVVSWALLASLDRFEPVVGRAP
jgi:hypothetical protein